MRKFLLDVLNGNSDVSSKRFITLMAFILMAIGFIGNLIFKLTILEFIYDSMKWIVIGGLGFTASEQFTKKMKSKPKETPDEEESSDDTEPEDEPTKE